VPRLTRLSLVAAATLSGATGCRHSASLPPFSSLTSDYAPAARFWQRVAVTDSTVTLHVDSALVVVPGPFTPASPPSVSAINVRALLVVEDSVGWKLLDASKAQPVADTLRIGESRKLGPMTFVLEPAPGTVLSLAFVVFEFRARAIENRGGFAVDTFVCSPTNVRGASKASRRRVQALEVNYIRACSPNGRHR